jgi:hypothetical protein
MAIDKWTFDIEDEVPLSTEGIPETQKNMHGEPAL